MKTALVVEDDESVRRILARLVELKGWVVVEATDGVDGIARFFLHRPDVILLDLNMPEMDGGEMLRRLRDANALDGVRIIVVTAYPKQVTDDLGVHAVVPKPFGIAELYKALGE